MVKKGRKQRTLFEYTQKQINGRFIDHWIMTEDFVENLLSDVNRPRKGANLYINPRRLHHVVESAYQDIARYKNYHQDNPRRDRLDCTKRCAYLAKWIVRFKPLQLAPNTTDNDFENYELDELEIVNEMLALCFFEHHLSDEVEMNVALSEEKAFELFYDLLYRQISADALIAIFQIFKDCCWPKFTKTKFIDKI